MATALAECEGGRITTGLVAGPLSGALPTRFEGFSSSHPFPDALSVGAGLRALELARTSRRGGSLVVLLSGGASSMLAVPESTLTLDDKARAARALMHAGIAIDELNCVRKHLSAIKGGRLAAAAGRTITLAISDVHHPVEDDPGVIGSGPTVADPTTFAEALSIVTRPRVVSGIPRAVVDHLAAGARGDLAETVKPHDERLRHTTYDVIASRRTAMDGAARAAREQGYAIDIVDRATRGEAREAGLAFAVRALRETAGVPGPVCVIASGETTVHVQGDGKGGRNQEFALAAIPFLDEHCRSFRGAAVLGSAGTDGIDGPTDAAGAIADTTSAARAGLAGLDIEGALARNASYDFFRALDDLIVWGPTGTNVGDVHVLLVSGSRGEEAGGRR